VFIEHDMGVFRVFLKDQLKRSYLLGTGFVLITCAGFVCSTFAIPDYVNYRIGLPALIVLSFFLCLTAGFFPLLQVFGQIGRPLTQSATYAILFIANILFNLIFIPWLGMLGAALGTGLAYLVYVAVFLKLLDAQLRQR
jgi:O-antigen/teichoic acid export membrane protein